MLLFVSYAREDLERIRELVDILREGGHEPWFDHQLDVGLDWRDQLEERIVQCDAFVYPLTPHSIGSEWCQWEFARASELGKPIIPILLDKAAEPVIPEAIKRRQYADFTDGVTPKAVARLLRGLNKIASVIPPQEVKAPDAPPAGVPSRVARSDDNLTHAALDVARKHGGASINLLMAELRVGRPRAKRLIDALEKRGVLGQYSGGGRLRPLIG
jgi:hypothetical protein